MPALDRPARHLRHERPRHRPGPFSIVSGQWLVRRPMRLRRLNTSHAASLCRNTFVESHGWPRIDNRADKHSRDRSPAAARHSKRHDKNCSPARRCSDRGSRRHHRSANRCRVRAEYRASVRTLAQAREGPQRLRPQRQRRPKSVRFSSADLCDEGFAVRDCPPQAPSCRGQRNGKRRLAQSSQAGPFARMVFDPSRTPRRLRLNLCRHRNNFPVPCGGTAIWTPQPRSAEISFAGTGAEHFELQSILSPEGRWAYCQRPFSRGATRRFVNKTRSRSGSIMRLLCGGPFVRLVSLCRFAYLADTVVYVCFSSEMVSCRSIPGAVALRSHREQDRRAETVTPGSDRGRRHSRTQHEWAGLAAAVTARSTLRPGLS
jgi:hypothetical protein